MYLFLKRNKKGAIKAKCYVDKPETIDALKENIHEAIGEIPLHTIDNVLKNWTDRGRYFFLFIIVTNSLTRKCL